MIRVELKGYDEALGLWDQKPVRKAAISALRRLSASSVTLLSKIIRDMYAIKKQDLDPLISKPKISGDELTALIVLSGKGIPLARFNVRQFMRNAKITRAKGNILRVTKRKSEYKTQGVEVEIRKGSKTVLRSAFMMNMQRGKRTGAGVMQRQGTKRLPTAEKLVISVAGMAQSANVQPELVQKVIDEWKKVFAQELNYYLNIKGRPS